MSILDTKVRQTNKPEHWKTYKSLKAKLQRDSETTRCSSGPLSRADGRTPPGFTFLKNKDGFLHSDTKSMAEIINDQFESVYTKEDLSDITDKGPIPYTSLDNINVHREWRV